MTVTSITANGYRPDGDGAFEKPLLSSVQMLSRIPGAECTTVSPAIAKPTLAARYFKLSSFRFNCWLYKHGDQKVPYIALVSAVF
jgi:hypothetical protein